ncbi:MAG: hypothetical protein WBP72_07070 [Rhodocyclaceae bacterium]
MTNKGLPRRADNATGLSAVSHNEAAKNAVVAGTSPARAGPEAQNTVMQSTKRKDLFKIASITSERVSIADHDLTASPLAVLGRSVKAISWVDFRHFRGHQVRAARGMCKLDQSTAGEAWENVPMEGARCSDG